MTESWAYCQVERETGGKCAKLMPCPDHPVRPVTEPRWALVRVPWKDDKHALDPLTVQIMFDFAETQGFDQRRCELHGIPKEMWKLISEGTMVLLQLGTHDEKPEYTNAELLMASEGRDTPDAWAKAHYLETPGPGSQPYELYKRIHDRHLQELTAIGSLLTQIRQRLAKMGVA